jgi:DNA-3-methyladenine glycosylase
MADISSRLRRPFFERETDLVARALIGCRLVHISDGELLSGRIVETEAYSGWEDRGSHASRGRTPRNSVMFGLAGFSYVYFIYGNYWLLNVVAKPPHVDYGAAVLIRAIEPVEGLQHIARHRQGRPAAQWTNGPGRLTMALRINGSHNGLDVTAQESSLYFEADQDIASIEIDSGPRIGLNVPEPWRSKAWRFWLQGNPHVSR